MDIPGAPSNFFTADDDFDLLMDKDVSKNDMEGLDEHAGLKYTLYQMR